MISKSSRRSDSREGENLVASPLPITSAQQLQHAIATSGAGPIIVRGKIVDAPSLRLQPGQELIGEGESPSIEFTAGADGVQLTSNNTVRSLALRTSPECRAIHNDASI